MSHRRGGFRGRSVPDSLRRKKTWLSFSQQGSLCAGVNLAIPAVTPGPGSDVAVLFLDSNAAAPLGLLEGTLLRIRGSILIPKSNRVIGSEEVTIAFGIGFVTDEAAEANAVPNPATAEGADWDGWLFYRANMAAPLDANATQFDSKAMRKWEGGNSLVLVAGTCVDDSGGEGAVDVGLIARALFLLP